MPSAISSSLPQDLATSSTPQFARLGLGAAADAVSALNVSGTIRQQSFRVTGDFQKTGVADNVATAIFTVTTANETGDNDGGVYICNVTAVIGHAAIPGNGATAGKKYRGSFTRAMRNSGGVGDGANTAVEDTFSGTSVSLAATKDIGTVTMAVTETSEYVQTVTFQVDLTGTVPATGEVTVFVEILYSGFITAPALAAA